MNRILYLPTRYFPSISGAELYLQRMAEIFTDKTLYKVDIYTSNAIDFKALRSSKGRVINKSDRFYDEVNQLKINRFSIEYNHPVPDYIRNLRQIRSFRSLNIPEASLKKILKNGPYLPTLIDFLINRPPDYDLIHTTYYPYFNLVIALILGEEYGIPSICTPFFHFSNPRYADKDLFVILRKFDVLIACTYTEKRILEDMAGIDNEKIKVIPMGVDYSIYHDFGSVKSYSFKKKFFKPHQKDYKMVLFCGYKNYEKGAISLLKSIPFILEEKEEVYFVFIGPSTKVFDIELSKIRKNTRARILNLTPHNLKGYFDKKKISAFFEADVVAMPSRSDAFGIVFLEAWASGTPVVGANIGATPEVIQNKVDGLLVEFDDPIDIAHKILRLLQNNKLNKLLGENGRRKVESRFTWHKVAQKTHELYQKLIGGNSL